MHGLGSVADLGSAEGGGGSWRGRMGVPYLGGGVRRVRPMVATSLSGPVLSFYGPWGWGGGGVEDCGTHTHQEN